jgi:preprotein translocase subunit SecD
MPGNAGVILTIGMAVDSSVLVLERIREELGTGKSVTAPAPGFSEAFATFVNTHVTLCRASYFFSSELHP